MLLSIKMTVVPIISIAIVVLIVMFFLKLFSKKSSRVSIAYIGVSILLLFGLMVMMNLKDEKGEFYWKYVNQEETKQL